MSTIYKKNPNGESKGFTPKMPKKNTKAIHENNRIITCNNAWVCERFDRILINSCNKRYAVCCICVTQVDTSVGLNNTKQSHTHILLIFAQLGLVS